MTKLRDKAIFLFDKPLALYLVLTKHTDASTCYSRSAAMFLLAYRSCLNNRLLALTATPTTALTWMPQLGLTSDIRAANGYTYALSNDATLHPLVDQNLANAGHLM